MYFQFVGFRHWAKISLLRMADISGLSSVLVQSRSRRAERSVAVAASDSDGSPPGCLSLGSTGQVVIHVYDRRNNATEFTLGA